jgi:hypothetical protein
MKTTGGPTMSKPDENVRWFTERDGLTTRVEALFTRSAGRCIAPSRDACRAFASALMVVRTRKDAAPLRQANIAAGILCPDITPSLQGARKSATGLLHHLKPLRRKLEILVADCETMGLDALHYREELARIAAVAEAVEALLPALDRHPLAPLPDGDPIRFIADKAQEAWPSANDGRAPAAKGADDPLVMLVTDALSLIGVHHSQHTVSAVLKGKRRPNKGVQK